MKSKRDVNYTYLLPRMLSIVYLAFISIFAFDEPIFSIGFIMHLIPTFIGIATLVLAWKNSVLGAIIFTLLGITTIVFFKTYTDIIVFTIISAPLFLVATLFYTDYYKSKHAKSEV